MGALTSDQPVHPVVGAGFKPARPRPNSLRISRLCPLAHTPSRAGTLFPVPYTPVGRERTAPYTLVAVGALPHTHRRRGRPCPLHTGAVGARLHADGIVATLPPDFPHTHSQENALPEMTGGQALAASLAAEGIEVVFGVPGAGQYEAVDGIYEQPHIRYIATRHEQATSYMADGYARACGKPAAILVVPGPGMYNAMSGITGACSQGSPMMVVSGEGHADRPVDDELAFIRGITKWAGKAESAADVPGAVHEAFRAMRDGRPGPAYLELPHRVLAATADTEPRELAPPEAIAPDAKTIEDGANALSTATRPAILVSGHITPAASEAIERLAELLQAPVLTSAEAKGALSDRHPLSMGFLNPKYQPLGTWLAERDAFLVVGPGQAPVGKTSVSVDVEPRGRQVGGIEIVGDIETSLNSLHGLIEKGSPARQLDTAELDAIREGRYGPDEQIEPQASFTRAIRSAMPDDGVLVQGMTQLGYYSRNYYPVYAPGGYLVAAHGTLGHTLPVALGAKIAQPDRPVVAVSGDGGFLYNSQELATAVQYGINVVAIVFNDNAYGNVLRAQIEEFDGHVVGTRLHNPDFVALAQSYGARGVLARDAAELESALRESIDSDTVSVIEVPVGPMDRRY